MRLCLFQPDIPQNTGAAMRLAAGLGVALDIIEPCGFPLDDARLKRVAMDYRIEAELERHESWEAYLSWHAETTPRSRLILMTTKATTSYYDFAFQPDDILIAGRESSGVTNAVRERADASVIVPLKTRSLNVVIASAMVLSEAVRQTKFSKASPSPLAAVAKEI